MTEKHIHRCWYCGEELGVYDGRQRSDDRDTCGKRECDRAARDDYAAEREGAHERLDRDMGWGDY